MKKQNLGKQIFSLFLALTLVLGMVGAIPLTAKADEAAAEKEKPCIAVRHTGSLCG